MLLGLVAVGSTSALTFEVVAVSSFFLLPSSVISSVGLFSVLVCNSHSHADISVVINSMDFVRTRIISGQ